MLNQHEIMQTIQMIDQQHLDVRTITMGISLRPMRATASMSMPALVEPTFTEEQTISVTARASGMERIRMR